LNLRSEDEIQINPRLLSMISLGQDQIFYMGVSIH